MLLSAYVQTAYLPSRIEVSTQYAKKLASVVGKFSVYLGRQASLADLTELQVCGYLSSYRKLWSARSTNNQRQVLLTLWQDAWDSRNFCQLLAEPPRPKRIRRLPEEVDPPEAWTAEEIRQLICQASLVSGTVCGIAAGDWWASLLLTIYWTSCRIGSMLETPSSAFKGNGLLVRKQKNHRPQWFPLPATCCQRIEQTGPVARRMIWPHPWHPRTVWTKMRQIVESAKLDCPRTGRQLFHRMRRTTLSLCAAVDPAIAQRQAGHADYNTTHRHYVDPRIARGLSAADILPDPLRIRNPIGFQ